MRAIKSPTDAVQAAIVMEHRTRREGDEMNGVWRVIDRLQSIGGVAAILAAGITATICLRYLIHGPEEVPPLLSHSMSVILGFYFGSRAVRGYSKDANPE
jgi:hypothetical protein